MTDDHRLERMRSLVPREACVRAIDPSRYALAQHRLKVSIATDSVSLADYKALQSVLKDAGLADQVTFTLVLGGHVRPKSHGPHRWACERCGLSFDV